MNRKEAIEKILDEIDDQDIVVSSAGLISRELYDVEDRPLNFYVMGALGNALAIGLGMALNTDRKVFVINGDGSALMSLGTFVTHKKLNPANLYHYILDNNCHESTGGQSTSSDKVDFDSLAPNTKTIKVEKNNTKPLRIPLSGKEIKERFEKEVNKAIETPIASILIPCFKRAELLDWGLNSLAKQECKYPFEVLVLNDGVEDETRTVCDKYSDKLNIRYIFTGYRNKNKIQWRCPGFTLNIGVKKARANFLIFTCAEIFHLDNKSIEKTIDCLKVRRKIMVRPQGKDDQKNEYLQYVINTKGKVDVNYNTSSMVDLDTKLPFFLGLHKEEFTCIGGYDEEMVGWAYDDTDLVRRMQCYSIRYIQIDSKIVHLYHPRHRMGIENVQKMYKHNKKLYEHKDREGVLYSNVGKEWGQLKRFEKPLDAEDTINNLWKFKSIPKVLHIYWGNENLPYLRYLTPLSFKIHNPDWKIKFYVPSKKYSGKCMDTQQAFAFTGQDYFANLRSLPNVEIITVDIPFINKLCDGLESKFLSRQEVYRSDFLRWYLLSTEGGVWADMDLMFFKPISDMYINQKTNEKAETLISLHPTYGHSVGFMLSAPNNTYYAHILKTAVDNFNPKEYQSIGVHLLNKDFPSVNSIEKRFPEQKGKVKDIPVTTVYAYDALVIPTIYNYKDMRRYTQHSIGLHWYAGHHLAKKYINTVTHLNYANFKNVLCNTIKRVYDSK